MKIRLARLPAMVLIVLVVVVGLLVAWSGWHITKVQPAPPVAPALVGKLAPSTATSPVGPDLLQRPLFWPERRPVALTDEPELPPESAPPPLQLNALQLLGVFKNGDKGGAIIRYKDKQQRLMTGQAIDDWELDAVVPQGVLLLKDGQLHEIELLPRIQAGAAK